MRQHANLKNIEQVNVDDLYYWKMPNIVLPFIVILISLVCFLLFKPGDKFSWVALINLLFNGSLPMVALNRIGGVSSNLFKFDKSKERFLNGDTTLLRSKLDDFSKYLLISVCILYIYQVIYNPFVDWSAWMLLQFAVSSIFIYLSLKFSKYAYLLQERLIDRTIGDDIRDEAKKTKKNLKSKYGNNL